MSEIPGYFEAIPAVRDAAPARFVDATVVTLDPLTVAIKGATEGVSAIGFAKVVDERGLVMVQGTRVEWFGGQDSPGLIQAEIDDVTSGLSDFEISYGLDQTAAAVELDGIRGTVDVLALEMVTTTRLAVLSTDGSLYMDGRFADNELSAVRATNSGLSFTVGAGFSGTGNLWLTGLGADESTTIPLTVGDLYTVRVWGTGLTVANGRVFAVKDAAGYAVIPTTYTAGGMAAAFVVGSTSARVQVFRSGTSGSADVTITRVEIRHGIGGTLIEGGSINTDHLVTTALDFWEAVGMKLTSPILETNIAAARGMKIIGDRLTGYSPTGVLQIDIGGPEGIIKGITIEAPTIQSGPEGSARTKWWPTGTIEWQSAAGSTLGAIEADAGGLNITGNGDVIKVGDYGTGNNNYLYLQGHQKVEIQTRTTTSSISLQSERILMMPRGSDLLSLWEFAPFTSGDSTPVLRFTGGGAAMLQTGSAANVFMATDGTVYRSSSSRRFKADIQDLDVDPYRLLDVPLRTWVDKAQLDADPGYATRNAGLIAEEVIAAGLPDFVPLEADGQPQTVAYDRLIYLLVPIVRDLQARLNTLETPHA